jgi:hypothetical protein
MDEFTRTFFTMANAFPIAEVAKLEVFGKAGLNLGN